MLRPMFRATPARWRPGLLALALALGAAQAWPQAAPASAPAAAAAPARGPAINLRIVGGLAGVNQFTRHEEPFWTREMPRLSGGRLSAEIVPFDRAGIRGQDMLRLLQLGVVPFGTALISQASGQEPLLGAPDLAGLNPDIRALRRHLGAFRPLLERNLRERHGIELLAVYVYPAQMLFCNRPLAGLAEVKGRRVRTSSPTQADWVEALGGLPVTTPFADIVANLRGGNIDCAITGSMSGNTIGLHEVTSHLHTMPINWGLSVFGANAAAWQALPVEMRALLRQELPRLEQAIWLESDQETGEGIACNIGAEACLGGRRGHMLEVRETPADGQRRREIFERTVLARWVQRCGISCVSAWNESIGPASGFIARAAR